jgi:hypothetical protein
VIVGHRFPLRLICRSRTEVSATQGKRRVLRLPAHGYRRAFPAMVRDRGILVWGSVISAIAGAVPTQPEANSVPQLSRSGRWRT